MKWLDMLEEMFIALTLLFSTCLVVINVLLRIFDLGTTWSEELIRYMIIWVTFIGISFCVRKGGHISIELIPDYLKGKSKFILNLFIHLVSIIFSGLLTWYSIQFVHFGYSSGQFSSALDVPMYIIYTVIPVSGMLMCVRYIMKTITQLKDNHNASEITSNSQHNNTSNDVVKMS